MTSEPSNQQSMRAAPQVVCAFLAAEGARAELLLNDIPIHYASLHRPIHAVSVHPFLIGGENIMEVVVDPGEHPSVARESGADQLVIGKDARVEGNIGIYHEGEVMMPEGGQRLAYRLFERADAPSDAKGPYTLSAGFQLANPPARWLWQDAPELDCEIDYSEQIIEVLDRYVQAHRRADAAAINELCGPQFDSFRRCFDWSAQQLEGHVLRILEQYSDAPDAILPYDADELDYRLVGHGRLLQVINRDWSHTVKSEAVNGAVIPRPMFLGLNDGQLRVML